MVVTAPDGSVQRVPGYWDGGRTWRVRYSSPQVGTHKWKLECSDASDPNLNGVTGELKLRPYQGDNPFYLHGFIRVASDQKHFEHRDGTPFLWLADTWWMGLTKRLAWPDDSQASPITRSISIPSRAPPCNPRSWPFRMEISSPCDGPQAAPRRIGCLS